MQSELPDFPANEIPAIRVRRSYFRPAILFAAFLAIIVVIFARFAMNSSDQQGVKVTQVPQQVQPVNANAPVRNKPRPAVSAPQHRAKIAAVDKDLNAVRAWLRENLDSGEWQEVRWWNGSSLKGSLVWMEDDPRVSRVFFSNLWNPIEVDGRSIRLKYRTDVRGARVLFDHVFTINSHGAVFSRVDAIDFRLPGESIDAWATRIGDSLQHPQQLERDVSQAEHSKALRSSISDLVNGTIDGKPRKGRLPPPPP